MDVPLFKMFNTPRDVEYVSRVINRGTFWATGPEIEQFEDRLAGYVGVKHAIALNSGTSALLAMLLANNIKAGDEIISPSFTFIATNNAILGVNAKPVFADIEDKTYGLDIESVKEKISPRTKGIMVMHYSGCPALYTRELKELAKDHKLLYFEDAAPSLGARINDQRVGSFGDSAIFSFCQNKIVTTGEGGAVVTDDDKVYERLKLIRSHGRAESKNFFTSIELFDYISYGFNFRMPTMCAALGLSQFENVLTSIRLRRRLAERYLMKLHKIIHINRTPVHPYFHHVYQQFPVEVERRDELMKYLESNGIHTKAYYDLPVHKTKFYRELFRNERWKLPVTEEKSKSILNLPLYPTMGLQELDYVVNNVKQFYKEI